MDTDGKHECGARDSGEERLRKQVLRVGARLQRDLVGFNGMASTGLNVVMDFCGQGMLHFGKILSDVIKE